MALTGLDIFKKLPKTNCKDCGFPTCLAFAMQLAAKKIELDKCPHVSEEAKNDLGAASAPPIKLIKVGAKNTHEMGNENVLYRHDETFYRPTGIAVTVYDDDEAAVASRVGQIKSLQYERVGMKLRVQLIAVMCKSGDAGKFTAAVKKAMEAELPLVLGSEDPAVIEAALAVCKDEKPLILGATKDNVDKMAALAKANGCPLAIKGATLEELAGLTTAAAAAGAVDLVVAPTAGSLGDMLRISTQIRRQALKKNFRPLGYPALFTVAGTGDEMFELVKLGVMIAKYGAIVVTDAIEKWQILPALTLSQNIFTDPRKPIMVEPQVYTVGEPGPDAPVLVTTNFSLTYFVVEGEVEASKIPAYIVAVQTEGLSVLTAWAAEKFTAESISKALKDSGVFDKVSHKKVIIPGYVAIMSGEIEEEAKLEILVGPREASGISSYLKTVWKP